MFRLLLVVTIAAAMELVAQPGKFGGSGGDPETHPTDEWPPRTRQPYGAPDASSDRAKPRIRRATQVAAPGEPSEAKN